MKRTHCPSRRHVLANLAAIGTVSSLGMRVTPTLAKDSDKAAFIKAANEELIERTRRISQDLERAGIVPALISPPTIEAFGDWDYFYIRRELAWTPNPGQNLAPVTVRSGFVSDLASVPQPFWSVLPRTGRYAHAAMVHDYLYWTQTTTRSTADEIFRNAMEDSGVAGATIQAMYAAVRAGGQSAWNTNATAKANGERRILSEFPTNPLISWSEWRIRPNVFID